MLNHYDHYNIIIIIYDHYNIIFIIYDHYNIIFAILPIPKYRNFNNIYVRYGISLTISHPYYHMEKYSGRP
jgi:hypothetical protein